MSTEFPLREAKARLSELLDRVENGEEIIITRHGHAAAKITSVKAPYRSPGVLKGQIKVAKDFDQTPEDLIDQFEGSTS